MSVLKERTKPCGNTVRYISAVFREGIVSCDERKCSSLKDGSYLEPAEGLFILKIIIQYELIQWKKV